MLLLLVLLGAVTLAVAAYSWWTLRNERLGREIHAHSDGTVHSHFRGSHTHDHPTVSERYDARLSGLFKVANPRVR